MTSERTAGLEVPVFAIPRSGDLGCGDTQVVRELIELAVELDLQSLSILPILETVRDNDPFRPVSLYALDPILLDVSPHGLCDLQPAAYARITANLPTAAGEPTALAYSRVKKLKLDLLWEAFESFWERDFVQGSRRARSYHAFCGRERAWLPDYCLYRMLMDFEEGRETWSEWSRDYRAYDDAKRFLARIAAKKPEPVERQLAFYAYVQWIADGQWRAVREFAEESGIHLITDLQCSFSPDCADYFRAPDQFRVGMTKGRKTALCRNNLPAHIEARLRRQARFFHQFRILDFRQALDQAGDDGAAQSFLDRLPDSESEISPLARKVEWESLPSLSMRTTQRWPAPNGQLIPPKPVPEMSFSSFGADSLRRLWSSDSRFRSRLRNQWAVNPSQYDRRTTLSLLRRLFQYPARDVQISYLDLAGLENDPDATWLARYEKGPQDLMAAPDWEPYRAEFRKILRQTARSPQAREKPVESV